MQQFQRYLMSTLIRFISMPQTGPQAVEGCGGREGGGKVRGTPTHIRGGGGGGLSGDNFVRKISAPN